MTMFWSVLCGVMARNFVTFVVRCAVGAWVREKRARARRAKWWSRSEWAAEGQPCERRKGCLGRLCGKSGRGRRSRSWARTRWARRGAPLKRYNEIDPQKPAWLSGTITGEGGSAGRSG